MKSQRAFTIVELLIVVVIIAILAAITIVAYTGIQTRARAASASSALAQAQKKLELYKVDNSAYPTTANLSLAGITNSSDTTYQYTSDGTTYCITATNVTISYYLNSTTTLTPTSGGCPGHGQGGVAAITNLASDPRATKLSATNGTAGWNNQRWAGSGSSANYSLITGASDGPNGITTYARKTWTVIGTGTGALGFDHTQASSVNDSAIDTTGIPASPNTAYTISSYLRSSQDWASVAQLCVWWRDSGGSLISKVYSPKVTLPANTWVRLSYTYTSPVNTTSLGIVSDVNGLVPPTGEILDGTGLMITQGPTLYTYGDGSSANWVWNGTANASTSTGPAL